jgi:putative ABC transport system permease protein
VGGAPGQGPAFELEDVVQERGGSRVLDGVSVALPAGTITAVVGPSGAGKTSLLRLLNRLDDPTSGGVRFLGRPVGSYPVRELRCAVGFVFQTPVMFPGTVADNLRRAVEVSPSGAASAARAGWIEQLLEAVELGGGYGARAADSLSGGEKQRVALARALATGPQVLLLDEPTSALDPEVAERLLATVSRLNAELGHTVVMVTHRLAEARQHSAFAVMLEAGRVVESGAGASTPPVDVSWLELGLAAGLVLVAMAVSSWQRLGLTRGFAVGAVRAVVQLLGVGYVLVYLFAADRWWLVLLALLVMLAAATKTSTDRVQERRRTIVPIAGVAMLVGAGLTLAYVDAIVLRPGEWYDPRYLVPIFGMIAGNAMNGAALAAERLQSDMEARRGEVEAYLALGAAPARACAEPVRRALTAALIPSVNGLAVVGLVALPGMMTGQILAGSSPLLAVRYQIVVAFMLAGAVAITSAIVVLWYRRTFFTAAEQLVARGPG